MSVDTEKSPAPVAPPAAPAPKVPAINTVGLLALMRRELKRTLQVINQVVWPPVISTGLYVLVIGLSLGSRVPLGGLPYLAFLVPGLVAMTVIDASYEEASASLFQHRFMNSIQELLVAPLAAWELVVGFVAGSVARALLLGNLLMLFLPLFTGRWVSHPVLYLGWMIGIAALFSGIGLVAGLLAEKWDQIAIPKTFLLTPLIWVGGAFAPLSLLPEAVRPVAAFNPIFYIMDGFRYAMVGVAEANVGVSAVVTFGAAVAALSLALALFNRGYKLRG